MMVLHFGAGPFSRPAPATEAGGVDTPRVRPPGRLIILPTATPPGAGSVRVSIHELFLPYVNIGMTDRFSVGGGASILPGGGAGWYLLSAHLTPIRTGQTDVGLGAWFTRKPGGRGSGTGYLNVTLGGAAGSVSAGTAWGVRRAGGTRGPSWFGGGSLQVNGETDIISEFFVPPRLDPATFGLGARWRRERVTAEFGFLFLWGFDGIRGLPIPWTSCSIEL